MPTAQMDPYAVLGIERGASLLEIARARRRLAKRFHPDVARGAHSSEQMRRVNAAWELLSVNAAWELLSDPERRRDWEARGSAHPNHAHVSDGWAEWTYSPRPSGAEVRSAPGPEHHVGWWTLIGVVLLLALILGSGLVAALDGPNLATRDSPVVQNNLDGR